LGLQIDGAAALNQVQADDEQQLRMISKEFSFAEKTFIFYALCLKYLHRRSLAELKKL
jgi:hypothetical protein